VTRVVTLHKYLILLSFLFSAAGPAWPAATAPSAAGAKEELQQLRPRIEALQKKLADAETSRNEAADALRESERAISEANRELAGLDQSSRAATQRAQALQGETRKTTELIESQQRALARLLHQQYVQQGSGVPDAPDVLRLALSGADPNDIARDLHYLGYVSRARGEAIRGMQENLAKLKSLSDETAARTRELAAIGAAQFEQRNRLEAERRKRAEVVGRLSRDIQSQRREIGTMQRNETRLTTLIEQLAKVVQRAPPAPRETQALREKPAPRGRGVMSVLNRRRVMK
jgi:septal ring factor EnvC (AmiA/AmiB activator)